MTGAVLAPSWPECSCACGRLDDRRTGPAKDGRRIARELDLVDQHLDPGDDDALQRRAFAGGAFSEQLKAELEAVGHDALLLADAHDDARHRSLPRHVVGDVHDAVSQPELVHQEALVVGTSCESRCSTIATASGTALATGSLSPMQPFVLRSERERFAPDDRDVGRASAQGAHQCENRVRRHGVPLE